MNNKQPQQISFLLRFATEDYYIENGAVHVTRRRNYMGSGKPLFIAGRNDSFLMEELSENTFKSVPCGSLMVRTITDLETEFMEKNISLRLIHDRESPLTIHANKKILHYLYTTLLTDFLQNTAKNGEITCEITDDTGMIKCSIKTNAWNTKPHDYPSPAKNKLLTSITGLHKGHIFYNVEGPVSSVILFFPKTELRRC